MKEKELLEENKYNNFYISESIDRARMVQQFWNRRRRRSTVLCIRVGMYNFEQHNPSANHSKYSELQEIYLLEL